MKSFVLILIITFSVSILSAQNESFVNNQAGVLESMASPYAGNYGGSTRFYNPPLEIMGTIYLFDTWENTGIMYTKTNQKFVLENINLNMQRNAFQVKISQDSIFTYYFNNIEKFEVNNKVYKNYFSENGNRIYEVIYESDEFSIIKGFDIEYITGSVNPMLRRKNDKYVRVKTYYVWKDKKIEPFKLNRRRILKLIADDQERVDKLKQFIEENKLSYRKSYDVKRALEYSIAN
jgi:hypothetical protein